MMLIICFDLVIVVVGCRFVVVCLCCLSLCGCLLVAFCWFGFGWILLLWIVVGFG